MKLWKTSFILLFLVILISAVPLIIFENAAFSGADGQAENVITEISPAYQPWTSSFFKPASPEIESFLFSLQAAIGAGILGFGFGRLSDKKKEGEKNDSN